MKDSVELFEKLGQMLNGIHDGTISIDQGKAGAQVAQVMVDLLKVEASIVNGSEGALSPVLNCTERAAWPRSPEAIARQRARLRS